MIEQYASELRMHQEEVVRDREAEWPSHYRRPSKLDLGDIYEPDEPMPSGRHRMNSQYGDSDE